MITGDQLYTDDFESWTLLLTMLQPSDSRWVSLLHTISSMIRSYAGYCSFRSILLPTQASTTNSQDALKYDQHIKSYVQYWVIMASVSQPSHFCFFSTHSLAVLLRMEITIDCSTTYPTHGLSSTIYCFRYIWLFQQLRLVLMPTVMIYYQVVLGLDDSFQNLW